MKNQVKKTAAHVDDGGTFFSGSLSRCITLQECQSLWDCVVSRAQSVFYLVRSLCCISRAVCVVSCAQSVLYLAHRLGRLKNRHTMSLINT